ncbi:hypothetical protein SOVF_142340 [Spinacia oleracea]|uniref:Late embryogenesis abundant protein LEA-2 subgroup domain-containing protein n=1 Tax=Spinacia oleracea TaxID=3562 RepID=A0A9R0JTM8_SPIOL|nr:uncharacterized protein LOC110786357 [Spinacia oleracea]KNA10654.1 hypothetical protein SOVF_142340 [Spinacia oleracea]
MVEPPAEPRIDIRWSRISKWIWTTIIEKLLILAAVCLFCFYLMYTPIKPTLSIKDVKIPTFTESEITSDATATFTVNFTGIVVNPPRHSVFTYSSSSVIASLFCSGQQVGSMIIPAKRVVANVNLIDVSISVDSLPVEEVKYISVMSVLKKEKPMLEMELKMKLVGKTTAVFWVFTRHVECVTQCRVWVVIEDGTLHRNDCV